MQEVIPIIAQQFGPVVTRLVDAAERSISIIVFDWRFYPTQLSNPVSLFNAAIARAAQRGVSIKALVSSAGLVEQLRKMGVEARQVHTGKLLHSKLLIVDDVNVVIGSHNYTQNGFSLNHEASVLVTMPEAQNLFVSYFQNLFGL